jgi:TPR repeat protein
MFNLGMMCQYGLGTPQNDTLALELYVRADAAGHWRAAYSLAAMYTTGAFEKSNCSNWSGVLICVCVRMLQATSKRLDSMASINREQQCLRSGKFTFYGLHYQGMFGKLNFL